LCREEASDLASLQKAGKLGKATIIGIIKEVAPCATAKTDEELGVSEFQEKYFPYPLYLDEEKGFYEALGKRTFSNLEGTWNPFKFFEGLKSIGNRIKTKSLEGNMRGEGLILGGIFVISPKKKSFTTFPENTGKEIPALEIIAAIKDC
jgi:AhpC/TSA antioxidant enzyme